MTRKARLLRFLNSGRKNKEKNKPRNLKPDTRENKNKDVDVYHYKCGRRNIILTVRKSELCKDPQIDSIFYYACAFCSKEFDAQAQICPDCGKPLTKVRLKKCPKCKAKNKPSASSCWVCSTSFPDLEVAPEKETRLLLTLNIDGNVYRNTDQGLGLGMKKLFEDLIACGFSREPLDVWAGFHEDDLNFKKEMLKEECKYLAKESKKRDVVYLVLLILTLGIGFLIFRIFWSN